MNITNEIECMIKCLIVAQEEYARLEEDARRNVIYWGEEKNMAPNKSLIRDNLRNVARMGFRVANKIGGEEDETN